ncbi:neuropeptide F receptor-like [Haliotis asinina]|uniref:neuropeptide F receptor-like n=1 Tax=Haliotis asinina TaxID=109174 RepID=UPI003531DCFD
MDETVMNYGGENRSDFWLGQNASWSLSNSKTEMLDILRQTRDAKYFHPAVEVILEIAFAILITFGGIGNGLVCYVVARNTHMRTPRNIFIINLAISDFTLCMFTQPLNLVKLVYLQWRLGSFMCKFVTMFQGTNVFVSTISITAIALDRFQVIVYPTKDSMRKVGAAVALISIWLISFLMASPFLLFSILKEEQPVPDYPIFLYRCIEDTDLKLEKRAYSVAGMVVQYVMPIIIVTVSHLRICNKLKYRMVNQRPPPGQRSPYLRKKNERNTRRKRKTNLLLAMIAVVFALSWLPLNIFNLLSEFNHDMFHGDVIDINLTYAICHLFVLCAGCLNPVLYGWLNENFRQEFMKVLCCSCCKSLQLKVKGSLCCRAVPPDPHPGVPAITLTKASNGETPSKICDEDGPTVTPLSEFNVVKS